MKQTAEHVENPVVPLEPLPQGRFPHSPYDPSSHANEDRQGDLFALIPLHVSPGLSQSGPSFTFFLVIIFPCMCSPLASSAEIFNPAEGNIKCSE